VILQREGRSTVKILVIEDNAIDFQLIERALGEQFFLTWATTLTDGIKLAPGEGFDLLILDLFLEDSRGYETFEKAHAAFSQLPILVLTGLDDEELALRVLADGAQDFVPKGKLLDFPLDRTARYAVERRRAEVAARTAALQYRTLLDNLPTAAFTLNAEGQITYFNQKAVELWGRTPKLNDPTERFSGSYKLFTPDGIPLAHDQSWSARSLREQKAFHGREIVVETPAGDRRTVLAHVTPIFDESGVLQGNIAVHVDITEQRRAERERSESDARFSAFMDNSPAVAFMKDDRGRWVYVSTEFARRLVPPGQDWIGKTNQEIYPPDTAKLVEENDLQVMREGRPCQFIESALDSAKRIKHWLVHKFPFRDQSGRRYLAGQAVDITERVEAERFARSTVNSLTAHIAILDEAGTIVATNQAWQRFAAQNGIGGGEKVNVGVNYLEVCDRASANFDTDARIAANGIRAVLRQETELFEMEYPCHAPDEERWFLLRVTPLTGTGPVRVVVAHENITSRKIAERLAAEQGGLKQAVAGMEQVLGVVGHELRTPLAALRAMSEFLTIDGARDSAEADGFLRDISEEVDRMSDTVNNLLEAARLNSGRARWNWSEFDLNEAIRSAIATIQPLVDPERVGIEANLNSTTEPMAGDAEAIRRLLVNLLSNARKHTARGTIRIENRRQVDASGEWMEIVVTDTGSGIAPEVLSRLGEAFALNSGVVGNCHVSGTGLGLAICKGIASAHGGQVLFESVQGKGTTATVRLRADLGVASYGDTVRVDSCQEVLV
jgi:PAS domain S-box-containing protein